MTLAGVLAGCSGAPQAALAPVPAIQSQSLALGVEGTQQQQSYSASPASLTFTAAEAAAGSVQHITLTAPDDHDVLVSVRPGTGNVAKCVTVPGGPIKPRRASNKAPFLADIPVTPVGPGQVTCTVAIVRSDAHPGSTDPKQQPVLVPVTVLPPPPPALVVTPSTYAMNCSQSPIVYAFCQEPDGTWVPHNGSNMNFTIAHVSGGTPPYAVTSSTYACSGPACNPAPVNQPTPSAGVASCAMTNADPLPPSAGYGGILYLQVANANQLLLSGNASSLVPDGTSPDTCTFVVGDAAGQHAAFTLTVTHNALQ
ncbi:MAG: hypothetical protein GIW95_09345 [Candidatus Eremiobacteraeota bacterium]|nr:hypothetical protein [Candidatus Eremiobacteraeota bacterium]